MDYHFAKSEFQKLLKEIDELLKSPGIGYHEADSLIQSTAVYIKNLFTSKEDDRKAYQKTFSRNESLTIHPVDRLINCKSLIELILVDINQNIRKDGDGQDIVHIDDEGKPLTLKQLINDFKSLEKTNRLMGRTQSETHHLFEQSKARVSELDKKLSEAENEKEQLRQKIQRLEAQALANSKSELAKYQASVADHFKEQSQKDNALIKKLKDDYQLLQSDIVALRAEKTRLEDKLDTSEKDLEKAKDNDLIKKLKKDNQLSQSDIAALRTEKVRRDEKSAGSERGQRDFYKLFLTSTYVLLSYVWLSAPARILGFEVKDNFKYGIAVVFLILYGVLFFSSKEKIKDNLVQFIIGIGAVVLAAFFFSSVNY